MDVNIAQLLAKTLYMFNIQDVVLDTMHEMGFILIDNNECYLKPYIRRILVLYSNMMFFMSYINNA